MHKDTTFKLRLPQDELAEWKRRAESESLSLAAWVRERCNEVPAQRSHQNQGARKRARAVDVLMRSQADSLAGTEPSRGPGDNAGSGLSARHTADSNWRTCGCETCVQKRKAVA